MLIGALTCWLAWSGSAVVLTGLLLVVLARSSSGFAAGLSLTIAGSERGLRGASAVTLASLQRSRRAQVCLDAAGDAISSPRAAAVVLLAQGGQVVFGRSAGVERSERTGRPWHPVAPDEHVVRPGVRYRVGALYFRLD